jgi:hypothetical protein
MRKGQIGARHVAWMRGAFERMRMPAKARSGKIVGLSREARPQRTDGFIRTESDPCHA